MEQIRRLETLFEHWFSYLPRLPRRGARWLALNLWWIVLILCILGSFGVLSELHQTLFISRGSLGQFFVPLAITGSVIFRLGVTLFFSIVVLVLEAVAVRPLHRQFVQGWNLLFLVILVELLSLALGLLTTFDVQSFVGGVGFTGVQAYLLFETKPFLKRATTVRREQKS